MYRLEACEYDCKKTSPLIESDHQKSKWSSKTAIVSLHDPFVIDKDAEEKRRQYIQHNSEMFIHELLKRLQLILYHQIPKTSLSQLYILC